MAKNILISDGCEAFIHLGDVKLRADLLLAINEAAMERGITPPRSIVSRCVAVWRRYLARKMAQNDAMRRGGILLCEAAVWYGISTVHISELLRLFMPAINGNSHIYSDETVQPLDTFLRAQALLAILEERELTATDEAILPEQLRKKKTDTDSGDNQEQSRKTYEKRKLSDLANSMRSHFPPIS